MVPVGVSGQTPSVEPGRDLVGQQSAPQGEHGPVVALTLDQPVELLGSLGQAGRLARRPACAARARAPRSALLGASSTSTAAVGVAPGRDRAT